jgi:hypothetical protein
MATLGDLRRPPQRPQGYADAWRFPRPLLQRFCLSREVIRNTAGQTKRTGAPRRCATSLAYSTDSRSSTA